MFEKVRHLLIATVLLGLVCALSCTDPLHSAGSGEGKLRIALDVSAVSASTRTIEAGIDQTVVGYRIIVGDSNYMVIDLAVGTTQTDEITLGVGTWAITADSLNAAGQIIHSGSASIQVLEDQVVPCEISLALATGDGAVDIDIDWPAKYSLLNCTLELLAPPEGETASQSLTRSDGTVAKAVWTNSSLPAGYYDVQVNLYSNTTLVKGFVDTVRVAANQTTTDTLSIPSGAMDFVRLPEMVAITGGTFSNGTADVTLSDYNIQKTEVTQVQYMGVMGYNASYFSSGTEAAQRPVERVTWYDAVEFCNKLSVIAGLDEVYTIANRQPAAGYPITSATVSMDMSRNGYRLPTEAEWEFAARGGILTQGTTFAGSDISDEVAWYNITSSSTTHTVAGLLANELGLYDMSGNVQEWCWDWKGSYSSTAQTDPTGPGSGSYNIERGGSYADGETPLACSNRSNDNYYRYTQYSDVGFRVVQRGAAASVAAPLFNRTPGTYMIIDDLEITSPTDGASIYYTIDGTAPDASSTLYTGAFAISSSLTIKAVAIKDGESSAVSTASFTITSPVQPAMVGVEGGSFDNGTSQVTLSGFYMAQTEITQVQWQAVMGNNPSNFGSDTSRPVENITWYDAVRYCNALSIMVGLEPVYNISGTSVSYDMSRNGYRLPTEAEWEYAARGGLAAQNLAYAGSKYVGAVAWYSGNAEGTTHPVAQKTANELGLYDMNGNVWEWCQDWYGSYYPVEDQNNPTGSSSGTSKVIRGGCFSDAATAFNTNRNSYDVGAWYIYYGFRVVRSGYVATVGAPVFDRLPGTYWSAQTLSITSATTGASIYYTTDGTAPSTSSTLYTGPISISSTAAAGTTIRAIAVLGSDSSIEHKGVYIIDTSTATLPEMVEVAGGSFDNGMAGVTVSTYSIGKTEVTQALWLAVMGTNPSYRTSSTSLPVEQITWYDAVRFCNALSRLAGRTPVYNISNTTVTMDMSKNGYRLPTEAEWEFAARGGNQSEGYTYSGSNTVGDVAWYSGNSGSVSHAVATLAPNELGLYDMSGNVQEWCWDWKGSYSSTDSVDPTGPSSGTYNIERGGCYQDSETNVRSSDRSNDNYYRDSVRWDVGLRVVYR